MQDDDPQRTNWDEPGMPTSAEADRERRLDALRELAREATAPARQPAPTPTTRTPLRPARREVSARGPLLGLLAVVVVAAGVGVYLWRTHQPAKATATTPIPPILATLSINLTKSRLYCPSGLMWSPDGLTVAVFADSMPCINGGGGNTLVALFNARTGAFERTFDPYAALAAANVQGALVQDVVWSPDRKTLVFPSSYYLSLDNTLGSGLLYYPLSGRAPRYVSGPASPGGGVIWNLRTGTPVTTFDNPLPTAASYAWSADGHLIADETPSTTPGHVSLFRAGTLVPIQPFTQASQDAPNPQAPPVSLLYLSWGTLVSPDDTYAAMDVERGARLPASPGSVATPALDQRLCGFHAFEHPCDYESLSPPDAGLTAVDRATAGGYTTSPEGSPSTVFQWGSANLAYRPDGKVLAAILPGTDRPGAAGSARKQIDLFDTTTGQFTAVSAVTQANASDDDPGIPPVVWSPSGAQLAYLDYFTSAVTIWGGSSLPA